MSIKLIVGLGNPGSQYEQTRHNVGQWYVESLARNYSTPMKPEKSYFGLSARGLIANQHIRLLIPTTFMNLSGKAVQAIASFYKITADEILVAHDELDLDVGTARLKKGGGHGGHNGLKSIIQSLGNNKDFYRLRIGIGHPGHKDLVTNYVLGKPSAADKQKIEASIDESIRVTDKILNDNIETAMNELHRRS
ncbi:MAG TPA: aminoacyl-tRNA hydrolase [Aeromonadales bacterium]|nr:aminoacyl-tRNA hydrolase [Aeromonadales bacterium]